MYSSGRKRSLRKTPYLPNNKCYTSAVYLRRKLVFSAIFLEPLTDQFDSFFNPKNTSETNATNNNIPPTFSKKRTNVSCEYDRCVVETQLCKRRDMSDTLIGRACAIFCLHYVWCLWIKSTMWLLLFSPTSYGRPFVRVLYLFMKDKNVRVLAPPIMFDVQLRRQRQRRTFRPMLASIGVYSTSDTTQFAG